MMDLYAVSPVSEYSSEMSWVLRLLDAGLKRYHFRKPSWSAERCAAWLQLVPVSYRRQISIHQYFEQAEVFGLGGVHHPDRGDVAWPRGDPMARSCLRSRSLHNLSNLDHVPDLVDYVFLSPIFPSISKVNYCSGWSECDLRRVLLRPHRYQLVALGGISEVTVERAALLGFDAVALHGCLWSEGQDPLQALQAVQRAGELAV
jgi:thiamine-phosphate pyrophosphorylase